jgi:mannose-6-phosphate isomerase-like protein (cupin superfamily)
MFINKDLKDAANPFPTLLIITKGKGQARLGDKTMSLREGMTVFVPAGMFHQFWTERDESLEVIIIMFGKGAWLLSSAP